jgi:hypothetical protein
MTKAVNVNSSPSKLTRTPIAGAKSTDFLANAREAYGDALPDWVEELAKLATQTTGVYAAKKIDVSPTIVTSVCKGRYTGDLVAIEGRVRGALMGYEVDCPGAGAPIRRDLCLREQKTPFNASSPHRVTMFRACRAGCPHSRLKSHGGADV